MSSLADAPDLVGFFSYSREDDEGSFGRLSKLRERIQEELRGQLGRTKKDFRLWQDKTAIAHGKLWEEEIRSAVAEAVFFIPIVTPTAVRSLYCKFEFDAFLAREKELGRNDLVFPILYIPVPALTGDQWRQDPLLAIIGSRQYEQWQNLRHLDASSTEVALRIETFCANICRALHQPWLSPEERREAEARRVAEAERLRQEAEIKQRVDEEQRRRRAEVEERRRGEDEGRRQDADGRRRLEGVEAVAVALQGAEPIPRAVPAMEPQRVKPAGGTVYRAASEEQRLERLAEWWLPPLIGAGAAAVPMLLMLYVVALTARGDLERIGVLGIIFMILIHVLYGGTAGMLVRRYGVVRAVAIPICPVASLILAETAFLAPSEPWVFILLLVILVLGALCVWLALWLWARKAPTGP
jgi:hypothetical protein